MVLPNPERVSTYLLPAQYRYLHKLSLAWQCTISGPARALRSLKAAVVKELYLDLYNKSAADVPFGLSYTHSGGCKLNITSFLNSDLLGPVSLIASHGRSLGKNVFYRPASRLGCDGLTG